MSGLEAIRRMWDRDRDSAYEVFTFAAEIVVVDGPVAVVRAEVRYGDPVHQEYRDLWVLRLEPDGRCSDFEEWPHWPGRSTGHLNGRAPRGRRPPATTGRRPPLGPAVLQSPDRSTIRAPV